MCKIRMVIFDGNIRLGNIYLDRVHSGCCFDAEPLGTWCLVCWEFIFLHP